MTAQIVVGLLFGDEGKGLVTDYLCSQNPNSIVVRFSGGQQAGHTVILDGIKHVYSNFCSGTLRGLPSYFSEHCTIYLNTISREHEILKEKGVHPRLYVHPLAKLTTPWDVAYNRVCEKNIKDGTCGLGVGATMKRHNETGHKLFAVDLLYPTMLFEKLRKINKYYYDIINNDDAVAFYRYADIEMGPFYRSIAKNPIDICDYSMLHDYDNVIFEGSQGILLDMNHGIFPNVTYAETTSKNAIDICKRINATPELYYVTRCYQTRHGNGFMSNDSKIILCNNEEEINTQNKWQGEFRISELDYDLLNHSFRIDDIYSYPYTKNLVVTCVDQRPSHVFEHGKIRTQFEKILYSSSPESNRILTLHKK